MAAARVGAAQAQPGAGPSAALQRAVQLDLEAEALLTREVLARDVVTKSQQAVAAFENAVPADDPRLLHALQRLASVYMTLHQWAHAGPINERCLPIVERISGVESLEVVEALKAVAEVYWQLNDMQRALPVYERVLRIRQKVLPPDHVNIAATLVDLASVTLELRNYDVAERHARAALAIYEKQVSATDEHLIPALGNLAGSYLQRGRYEEAEKLTRRALAIAEVHGHDTEDVAKQLSYLGGILTRQGDDVGAEPYFKRSLAIMEKLVGPSDLALTSHLNNLGQLYYRRHDYARARPLLERRLEMVEQQASAFEHMDAHTVLGQLEMEQRNWTDASHHYEEALRTATQSPTLQDEVPAALYHLATVRLEQRSWDDAVRLLYRAQQLLDAAGQSDGLVYAATLKLLAWMEHRQRNFDRAEALYRKELAIRRAAGGRGAGSVGATLEDLAALFYLKGDIEAAAQMASEAGQIQEEAVARTITVGSEAQKRAYLNSFFHSTNLHVSIAVHPEAGVIAAVLGATTILRRKGRILDALAQTLESARSRATPDQRKVLDALIAARAQLANETIAGPRHTSAAQHRALVSKLEQQIDDLENELSAPAGPLATPRIALDDVVSAIPADAALVEWVKYGSFDAIDVKPVRPSESSPLMPVPVDTTPYSGMRYAACVLRRDSPPVWVDLGDAGPIEEAIALFRAEAIDRPYNSKSAARLAYDVIWRPLLPAIGDSAHVLLAPDGMLNLVPFAALVDEGMQYQIEVIAMTFLSSGRDMMRSKTTRDTLGPAVVIGDPDYGRALGVSAKAKNRDLAGMIFPALPGARDEARKVASILGTKPWLGAAATESAVKQIRAPSVLHLATHAFFVPEESDLFRTAPMLRSGLALAGANTAYHGDDDGILTALELTNIDLQGTRLVTLSACNTGNGEASIGDGVYGLRRALSLAGAETQVMSLWPIGDQATKQLMVEYYQRLARGEGRVAAMRQAQRTLQRQKETAHPFYWAGFMVAGSDAALDGSPGVASADIRGPRGCGGCQAKEGAGSPLVVLALWLLGRRRRGAAGGA